MEEQWKEIEGYESRYLVSNFGRVKSINGKYKKSKPDGYITTGSEDFIGYRIISLHNRSKKYVRIHSLVARAFIPNPENKPQVNHKDGNKSNNHISNLEWVTHKENLSHAVRTGLHNLKGENHPNCKLTKEKVFEIRDLRKQGFTHQKIADMFGIDRRQVGDICNGVNWGWLK